ncbi:uncharacterized protein G2W53_032782 [Senna tora]|uniref:Integrase catalytic domain-containing protein n=1 Tax=Senna tora TaxID=362788 RepID=A0A834WAG5_9FABA|nr:uncharacterized protein G2W53_032782 [Senna tora]
MTIPGTPQQNGVAERRNITLLDMVRSMMAQANLPISYCGDALLTTTFILNRVPSTSVASTSYELWTKRKPDLSILRPWGSAVYIHDNSHKYGKLGPRGKTCIFIRYSEQSKGYVFIGENEDGTVTEIESRDGLLVNKVIRIIQFSFLVPNRIWYQSKETTMANPSDNSSGSEKNDQPSQLGKNPTWTLTNGDQLGVALVTYPLIRSNYIAWSIAFRTALEAKQKIDFINGTIHKPTDAAEYEVWKPIDSMVKSWLTSSISKEISESLIHCDSAFALWKELEERFGTSCGPQLYHIQREMVTTEQGTDTITKYWNRLHRWWDEWTRLSPSPRCHCGKCTCEVNKRLEEKESSSRLIQFLMGLNQSFDPLRGQILNLDPMPMVNRAYNMAIQLERQREVNLTYGGTNPGASISAGSEMVMVAKGARNEGYRRREMKEEKYSKYCEHCHMNGHLKEACFKLQGYPNWYKELKKRNPNNKKPSNLAASVGDSPLEDPPMEKTEQGNQMAVLSMLMKELTKVMKGGSSESINFAQLDVYEIGSVVLKTGIEITNVLHIPSFKYNMLSEKHKVTELTPPTTVISSGNNEVPQGQDEWVGDQHNGKNDEATEEVNENVFDTNTDAEEDLTKETEIENQQTACVSRA